MQAIQTRFIPATNTKPNRIKAFCAAGMVTMCSDNLSYASHDERSHLTVAKALADKLGWNTPLLGGSLLDNNYCFIVFPQQIINNLENVKLIDHPYNEGILKSVIDEYYK